MLTVALIILGSLSWRYLAIRPLRIEEGLQKGKAFPTLPGVDYSMSNLTLLIAMSSKCEFCQESVPFYNQLAESIHNNGCAIRVIACFQDFESDVNLFVGKAQLDVETISGVDFRLLKLPGTPAMILVDSNGTILDFWVGKLSKDTEQQITDALCQHKKLGTN